MGDLKTLIIAKISELYNIRTPRLEIFNNVGITPYIFGQYEYFLYMACALILDIASQCPMP
jgi:hypothetical protein